MGSFELDKLSVGFLYDRYKKNRLDVQPDYQRSKAWSDKFKHELIDTVLNEWPMGLIMLNLDHKLDSDGKPVDYHDVVDGQQRLRCLFEYRDGTEQWTKDAGKKGNKLLAFGDLSDSAQERFTEYRVSVALMRDYDTDEILDVFSRLQNAKPLRIGERLKALRTPHKPYLKEITDHPLFDLGDKTRDAHWNLAAVIYLGTYNDNPLERHEYDRLAGFLQGLDSFDEKRSQKAVGDAKRIMNLMRRTFQEAITQDGTFNDKVRNPRLFKWTFASLAMLDRDYLLQGREHLLAQGLRGYQIARDKEETPEWLAYLVTGRTGRIDTEDVRVCLEYLKKPDDRRCELAP